MIRLKENSAMQSGFTGLRQQRLVDIYDLCARKTRRNIQRLADRPVSGAWAVDGNYFDFKEGFYEIGNWTSSFFTGMALLAWRQTEDEYFLNQVLRLAPHCRDLMEAISRELGRSETFW